LSQNAFAEWLGVGRASLERWERGGNMQNQSMDNLILLLSNQAHKSWLDNERHRRFKVSSAQSNVVSFSRFRALRPDNSSHLTERARTFKLRR
jgi:transcriptional regulator with XRE-family HTH domain